MLYFPTKGKGIIRENVKVDDHERDIRLTYRQFTLLCETLNNYTSSMQIKPPKVEVKKLEQYLVSTWHSQDREKVEYSRRDTDND